MLFSKYFIPTLRETKEDSVSFNLSLRAGLISPLAAGIYSYLPLGLRVLKNIEKIIRNNMDACGAHEVLLPALQPLDLWQKTGRDDLLGEVMFRFKDRKKRGLCLAPTHEEAVTDLVAKFVSSYRQLPLILYQIQTKFRDELRPRSGLIRGCEFVMKDAYSFDRDQESLNQNYEKMFTAYKKIFSECGLNTIPFEADTGFIGGNASHEFLAEASSGEDIMLFCGKCGTYFKEAKSCPQCSNSDIEEKRSLELGHVFKLGDKYSRKLSAFFLDEQSKRSPLVMGCYGIGVSRIISAVIEQNNDKEGIVWPENIAPFDLEIVCLNPEDKKINDFSFALYNRLSKSNKVLLDERQESAGVKFKDAYLLGLPYLIVVGKNNFYQGKVEIIIRRQKEKRIVSTGDLAEKLNNIMSAKGK